MKQNKLKQKMTSGEVAYGVLVSWPCPEMVEFFGYLGYDWAFIDAEHGTIGREMCTAMVRACDVAGIVPLVRVPDNDPATILGYLETGTLGIIVPHISSADDARRAVAAIKYSPEGSRSAGSTSRLARYGLGESQREYFSRANDEVIVYALVEDANGIKNLDEILALDGVDMVGIGPGDLAMSLGYPGQSDHPDVKKLLDEARSKVAAAKPARLRMVSATTLLAKAGREFLLDK